MDCEKEQIRRILGGETDLFEEIVLRYQRLVYTLCIKIVQNEQDAQNLTQETFLKAYISLATFQGDVLKPWICRIAANNALDFKRKCAVMLRYENLTEDSMAQLPDQLDIAAYIESGQQREKVRQLVNSIPDKYSQVILAHYFEGLTVPEIASREALPPKTVETRLYRGRKMLKECLCNENIR